MAEKKKTYSEKLRDPRWQKKRLEILQRDGWACRQCFDTGTTLHVHHVRYLPKHEPWDYPEEMLMTLCEDCHQSEYEERDGAEKDLLDMLRDRGFFAHDVHALAQAFLRMPQLHIPDVLMSAICWGLSTPEALKSILYGYFADLAARRQDEPQKP